MHKNQQRHKDQGSSGGYREQKQSHNVSHQKQQFGNQGQRYHQGGYYDNYGFYMMKDGSFYDPEGRFFDMEGHDENGGYYKGTEYIPGKVKKHPLKTINKHQIPPNEEILTKQLSHPQSQQPVHLEKLKIEGGGHIQQQQIQQKPIEITPQQPQVVHVTHKKHEEIVQQKKSMPVVLTIEKENLTGQSLKFKDQEDLSFETLPSPEGAYLKDICVNLN